jgi:hypothetical protein
MGRMMSSSILLEYWLTSIVFSGLSPSNGRLLPRKFGVNMGAEI